MEGSKTIFENNQIKWYYSLLTGLYVLLKLASLFTSSRKTAFSFWVWAYFHLENQDKIIHSLNK